MGRVDTIVVLRALGLGDLCAGVPALRALRRAHPAADLVLAAPAWQEPLARLAGVDRVVDTAPLEPLAPELDGADLAVNLHGRGPQSTALLARSRPRHLVAFRHDDVDATTVADVTWRAGEHEVERWCRLLNESGIEADPADIRLATPQAAAAGRSGAERPRTAVVHPGAAAPARRWPADRFGQVVAALVADDHRVLLTGTADERDLCQAVLAAAGPAGEQVEITAGDTSVSDLAALVAGAAVVVANDTGVAHLATAFGTPSVVLFGPTPPSEWGPPASSPHRALWAGRRGDPHGQDLDPGLARICVDEVLSAVAEVTRRVPA